MLVNKEFTSNLGFVCNSHQNIDPFLCIKSDAFGRAYVTLKVDARFGFDIKKKRLSTITVFKEKQTSLKFDHKQGWKGVTQEITLILLSIDIPSQGQSGEEAFHQGVNLRILYSTPLNLLKKQTVDHQCNNLRI